MQIYFFVELKGLLISVGTEMSSRTPAQKKAIAAAVARKNAASSQAVRYAPRPSYAPRRYAVHGKGDYWTDVKKRWGQGGGSMKGAFEKAGGALGGPVGSVLGGLLNRGLYAITGFGDYVVKSNVLLETNGPPEVVNRSNKEFVVRHREYITDIYSLAGTANTPSAFGLQTFPINPGSSVTFPWLSTVADKFEQYRIEGMLFEFKSLYSDAVVTQNGSIGSTILATEYNSGAPSFSSKQAMENYQFAQSAKPSCSILHPIECARNQNVLSELYVRPGSVPSGEDVKTYDFGDFQIASQGIPLGAAGAAVNLGELWVTYQIALIKPRIPTASSTYTDSGFAHYTTVNSYTGAFTTALPAPKLITGTEAMIRTSSSNILLDHPSNNVFTIPLGSTPMKYQIDMYWRGIAYDAANVWSAPTLAFTNCSGIFGGATNLVENLVPAQTVANAAKGSGVALHYLISCPAATPSATLATITLDATTAAFSATTGVRFDMYVNAVPVNVD